QTILVTGANRGIGFSIVQSMATAAPNHTYIVGSRKIAAGEDAVRQLLAIEGLSSVHFEALEIDILSDESVKKAVAEIESRFGGLDTLVNNAGMARIPKPDGSDLRDNFNQTFATNVTATAATTFSFLPLLKKTPAARVINVSSSRGSLTLQTTGKLPPTASIAYTASKSALNVVTLEMQKLAPEVSFWAACPGYCKTAFNGFRGKKDPLDGARVVRELALSESGK
ncbi:hypothetical protein BDY21DRAFT_266716, partial [Lineolata rhizophorae]